MCQSPAINRSLSTLAGIFLCIFLIGLSYAAGYYHRDVISRRRHERARLVREGLLPGVTNVPPADKGDLGTMLDTWAERTRNRKSG